MISARISLRFAGLPATVNAMRAKTGLVALRRELSRLRVDRNVDASPAPRSGEAGARPASAGWPTALALLVPRPGKIRAILAH